MARETEKLTVLEFVDEVPPPVRKRTSKWDPVIEAARKRTDRQWAKVVRPPSFQTANITWLGLRAPDLEVKVDSEFVYVRVRGEEQVELEAGKTGDSDALAELDA